MDKIQCQIQLPEGLKALSVGQEFILSCPLSSVDSQKTIRFEVNEKNKYDLKLLRKVTAQNSNEGAPLKFVVTSYRAGDIIVDSLKIIQDTTTWEIEPIALKIESVIDASKGKPEPFGPVGPLTLGWPLIWWLYLAAFIFVWVIVGILTFFKIRKIKRLQKYLEENQKSGTPESDFYRTLRRIKRAYSVYSGGFISSEESVRLAEELKEIFVKYLCRTFEILGADLKSRSMKKKLNLIRWREVISVDEILFELSLLEKSNSQKANAEDLLQLTAKMSDFVDQVEKFQRSKK